MTIDLDQLEAAAKAATPGPWVNTAGYKIEVAATGTHCASAWERYTYEPDKEITSEKALANAAYIAAANPAVVLELVAELRKAQDERDWLANDIATKDGNCPPILQDCTGIVCTTDVCKKCWLKAAREAVEKEEQK